MITVIILNRASQPASITAMTRMRAVLNDRRVLLAVMTAGLLAWAWLF